jgi:hypothetical protein
MSKFILLLIGYFIGLAMVAVPVYYLWNSIATRPLTFWQAMAIVYLLNLVIKWTRNNE